MIRAETEITLTRVDDGLPGAPGKDGADGFSPIISTGESEDGSTIITITDKEGTTSTELKDGQAREDINDMRYSIDNVNNSVFGQTIYYYLLNGVEIPVYQKSDETYYYILNDVETPVAESDLVMDEDGSLKTSNENGLKQDIQADIDRLGDSIGEVKTWVDSFDEKEKEIYNAIEDNSLISRKNARVEQNSLIITNDTDTDTEKLKDFLQLNPGSMIIYSNAKGIVTIAKTQDDAGYLKLDGQSLLEAVESKLSTIRLRSAKGEGRLAIQAGSNGHISIKEVL